MAAPEESTPQAGAAWAGWTPAKKTAKEASTESRAAVRSGRRSQRAKGVTRVVTGPSRTVVGAGIGGGHSSTAARTAGSPAAHTLQQFIEGRGHTLAARQLTRHYFTVKFKS
ncbi:hypothetical protein GCM10020229_70270 [Kitasatospora albolonga]